jgi:glutamyl-Q tRNA(Asp) synthetase
MGSLVAAVGSYLRAKEQRGKWLVRMEDIDTLREKKGSAASILHSLEAHGLYWDEDVVYQSQRHAYYQQALDVLIEGKLAYPCSCSRKFLLRTAKRGEFGVIYPSICRTDYVPNLDRASAIRLLTDDAIWCFTDKLLGLYSQHVETEVGDFIIKRSDGLFAYQLVVVVDDHLQGITEVVRGEDLLSATPRQLYLQSLFAYQQPNYMHLPLMLNEQQQKLSKQTFAQALDSGKASANLIMVLRFLGFRVSQSLDNETPERLLQWAGLHYSDSVLAFESL